MIGPSTVSALDNRIPGGQAALAQSLSSPAHQRSARPGSHAAYKIPGEWNTDALVKFLQLSE
jgi:hypothetical protein